MVCRVGKRRLVTLSQGVRSGLPRWNGYRSGAGPAFAPSGTVWKTGDSTTSNFTALFTEYTNFTTKPGELMSGVTVLNRGNNGADIPSFLNDGVTYGLSATISAAPPLIEFCYGINDVRLGTCGSDYASGITTLRSRIVTAVDALRAGLPTTDIVLVIPNSLGSDDPGATGFVPASGYFSALTQAQRSQMATDIIWNAYIGLTNRWPNVIVVDKQTGIYGRTCQPVGTLLNDILHPKNTSAHAETVAAFLAAYTGYRAAFDSAASAAAWAANPGAPVAAAAAYARAFEDTRFMTYVAGGRFSAMGANSFIDFAYLPASDTHTLDYVQQAYGLGNFQIPGSATISTSGSNTRCSGLGSGKPPYTQSGGTVRVYRLLP